MFEDELKVKVKCEVHPDFDPTIDHASAGCKCCAAIECIKGWMEMAQRSAAKIETGYYKKRQAQTDAQPAAPMLEDICFVASDISTGSGVTPVKEDKLESPRLVRRKGAAVQGGGRLKVKSAPEKPKFRQESLL